MDGAQNATAVTLYLCNSFFWYQCNCGNSRWTAYKQTGWSKCFLHTQTTSTRSATGGELVANEENALEIKNSQNTVETRIRQCSRGHKLHISVKLKVKVLEAIPLPCTLCFGLSYNYTCTTIASKLTVCILNGDVCCSCCIPIEVSSYTGVLTWIWRVCFFEHKVSIVTDIRAPWLRRLRDAKMDEDAQLHSCFFIAAFYTLLVKIHHCHHMIVISQNPCCIQYRSVH